MRGYLYAGQMIHVATRLPRCKADLDIWQVFTPGSDDKVYKTTINIKNVVAALEWLRLNNPLCISYQYVCYVMGGGCVRECATAYYII